MKYFQRLKYWLSSYGDTFNISSSGDIVLRKPLDYETVDSYGFLVFATDGYMVRMLIKLYQ